jgi:hypothetical protein
MAGLGPRGRTGNTRIASSPRWLITFTEIRPDCGRGNGRLSVRYSVAHASEQNPGTDLPVQQLTRGQVTDNSRGFHLGRMPEIRTIIEEECEKALAGQQGAKQALDSAVERGNKVLRDFQKSVHT